MACFSLVTFCVYGNDKITIQHYYKAI